MTLSIVIGVVLFAVGDDAFGPLNPTTEQRIASWKRVTPDKIAVESSDEAEKKKIVELVASLGHDSDKVRDSALATLSKSGTVALKALAEADKTDLEVRLRSEKAIAAIMSEFVSKLEVPKNTGCSFAGFAMLGSKDERFTGLLPDCTVLSGSYHCAHRAPFCFGEVLIGVSHRDGTVFMISHRQFGVIPPDAKVISKYLRPIESEADAIKVCEAILDGGERIPDHEKDKYAWKASTKEGAVTVAGKRKLNVWAKPQSFELRFDAKGRLAEIVHEKVRE